MVMLGKLAKAEWQWGEMTLSMGLCKGDEVYGRESIEWE
jgi:hypothetical protein